MPGVDELFSFDEPSQDSPDEQLNNDVKEEGSDQPEQKDEKREDNSFSPTDPTGKRFEHWQREAYKKDNELKALQKQLDELNAYKPVIEHVKANPQLLFQEKEKQPSQKEQQLVKPEKPVKPHNYSKAEALADPESPSAKYEEALTNFNEQLADYIDKKNTAIEERDKKQAEALAKAEQEKKAVSSVHAALIKEHGMSNDDASDFIKFMNDPQNQKLENYVELYKIHKAKGGEKNKAELDAKKKEFETKKKNGETPGGTGNSGGNDTEGNEDKFLTGVQGFDSRNLFKFKKQE
jgi:hypothetical protein